MYADTPPIDLCQAIQPHSLLMNKIMHIVMQSLWTNIGSITGDNDELTNVALPEDKTST